MKRIRVREVTAVVRQTAKIVAGDRLAGEVAEDDPGVQCRALVPLGFVALLGLVVLATVVFENPAAAVAASHIGRFEG